MTVNEFKIWLDGYKHGKEKLDEKDMEIIEKKLNEIQEQINWYPLYPIYPVYPYWQIDYSAYPTITWYDNQTAIEYSQDEIIITN